MHRRLPRRQTLLVTTVILALMTVQSVRAVHESTNTLVFAPIDGSSAPAANGRGVVDFHGGEEAMTRWTATFQFTGLQPGADYTVVVKGRFGQDGSTEADEFAPICSFAADQAGNGGCWYYFLELRRLGIAQLRLGDAAGTPILQATRQTGGPGSMASVPNRFSPPPAPTPTIAATPAPVASPSPQATPTTR